MFQKGIGNFQPATFLTFGQNYGGVPSSLAGYVYLYGPKQSPKRGSGNKIYLLRCAKEKIRDRAEYEYFAGLDSGNKPSWTREPELAKPVFEDPNGVSSPDVVYDAPLKRYLLANYHTGPGQLGIFDGPEPWGPWTTVAYYESWGDMGQEGEGLSCQFPSKWMSAGGLDLWCVFAVYGDGAKRGIKAHDRFNVVKATLSLRPAASAGRR
jgi:hypothetical protein